MTSRRWRGRGILLGRTTYKMFEPAWSTRTVEDEPGAPFFNDTTKYVVSATLTTASWRNSTIVGPYDPGAIRRLKDDLDGDLYVSGSGTLVRAMLADGLVDELHLFVYPLTRGSGRDSSPSRPGPAACRSRPVSPTRRSGLPGLPTAGVRGANPRGPRDRTGAAGVRLG